MKDLYTILGVPESAEQEAIKKAYRKLAKENHPDATGNDKRKTERFKEINEAYGVLGEDKKRREYDRLRRAPVGADGMPQGFDADMFAQVFGGAAGGGARGAGVNVSGDFDISDMFSTLFGGQGGPGNPMGRGRVRVNRGADVLGRVEIPFREAALGARRTVRAGTGNPIDVQVPAGVESGARLRVPGQGARATGGGAPGDLHLEVLVIADPHLRRGAEADDVEIDLPLSIAEATLGTKVEVPTVDGPVRVTIPAGTSSGAKLRVRGKGFKRPDGSRGDQIVHVGVVVPRVAADDTQTRTLIEELDKRTRAQRVRDF